MDQKKKTAIDILKKKFGNISECCAALGISRQTFYLWKKEDADFKEAVDNIDEYLLDFAENKLYSLINKGNIAATIFYLKTKGKGRGFVERTEVQEVQAPKFQMFDARGMKPEGNEND